MVLAGENYRSLRGDAEFTVEGFLAAADTAAVEGLITPDEATEIRFLSPKTIIEMADIVKPTYLFFPKGTPIIDDDATVMEDALCGMKVLDEYKDKYPNGRVDAMLPKTGIQLAAGHPMINVSTYSLGRELPDNFSPETLKLLPE